MDNIFELNTVNNVKDDIVGEHPKVCVKLLCGVE